MDSLTQITLGAAVGEVVLGKKVGNRAMLWGAIGGTLPDLDVIANISADQLGALAYHRAISHSFLFAIVAPLALGWTVHRLYKSKGGKAWWRDLAIAWAALMALLTLGAFFLPIPAGNAIATGLAVSIGMILPPVAVGLRERWRKRPSQNPNASWRSWSWLLFWAIFTHPLLDCCTSFGTQIFQPFSDYRAAFNNIAVVDPLYTVPFLICVLITTRLARNSSRRRLVIFLGLGLSTAYLLFSVYNKYRINQVFEENLKNKNIAYQRYMTTPTLMNNILWQAVIESDSVYYYGLYSLLDDDETIEDFRVIPKNHGLVQPYRNDRALRILTWFSNDYYSIETLPGNRLQFNDLRFGGIQRSRSDSLNFVFKFVLEQNEKGELEAYQAEASRRDLDGAAAYLWERIKGD